MIRVCMSFARIKSLYCNYVIISLWEIIDYLLFWTTFIPSSLSFIQYYYLFSLLEHNLHFVSTLLRNGHQQHAKPSAFQRHCSSPIHLFIIKKIEIRKKTPPKLKTEQRISLHYFSYYNLIIKILSSRLATIRKAQGY